MTTCDETRPLSILAGDRALLDRGYTSDVYEWGPQRILKLFLPGKTVAEVEGEYVATQAVRGMGLPVPVVYEVIEVDGRPGIAMERVVGVSLFHDVQSQPWRLMASVRQLAELHAQVNSCPAPETLPSQRLKLVAKIESASCLSEAEKQEALHCLKELPDGTALCHGDFHPGNIIVTANGPVIIDWGSATRGHPAGDAAVTTLLIQHAGLPPWSPRYMHWLLAATRSVIRRTYLSHYVRLNLATREQIDRWYRPIASEVDRRLDRAAHSGDCG